MQQENEILDIENIEGNNGIDVQNIISVNKFIFFSIISLGLYEIWWIYKAWKFFKQKHKLDIMPAARAIFSIFFLHDLFQKILTYAKQKEYSLDYSPLTLFIGFFASNLLSKLPDPYWLISVFSFLFFIQPFKALNYAKINSDEFISIEQNSFSGRQIALILGGLVFWALILFGMYTDTFINIFAEEEFTKIPPPVDGGYISNQNLLLN